MNERIMLVERKTFMGKIEEIEATWKSPDHCPAGVMEIHNQLVHMMHYYQYTHADWIMKKL